MVDEVQLNQVIAPLGDKIAADEIAGRKHQRVKVQVGLDGTAQDVHDGRPMPVLEGMTSPQTSHDFAGAVASGGIADLDGAQISSGLTGKLVAFLISASVPMKAELKTVLNGVESGVLLTAFANAGQVALIKMPSKEFFTQVEDAGVGLDAFRVTATNLDNQNAADLYATFFYDEE
jgi:hypothetical protein